MKTTFQTSSDVALIKYWGKKPGPDKLPENGSLSMVLEGMNTITTVEFQPELTQDDILIEGERLEAESARASEHLDRIRQRAEIKTFAKVVSQNTFPRSTGLSSSASGFAALTLAGAKAAGLQLTQVELSILARYGSGSACRCVCGGFVEWRDAETSEESYAQTLFPAEHFELVDIVTIVSEGKKRVGSTEGHQAAHSSPFYAVRLEKLPVKIEQIKAALQAKDFTQVGAIAEAEALEFHTILLTSNPPLIAWYPGTIEVMLEVQQMRREGLEAYFTINTGFNVHVLTLPEHQDQVEARLQALPSVKKTLAATVGNGPKELQTHLF